VDIVAPVLEAYTEAHTTPVPAHLRTVDERTRTDLAERARMMVGSVEGRFLEMLVFALGARQVLEIGTFSGYSALAMAAGLAPGGHIVSCEIDPTHAAAARRNIAESPYAESIEVIEGPALDTIAGLAGPFDLVFVDADKRSYGAYYEAVLPKLSERGLLVADNTLWSGRIVEDSDTTEDTVALRAFNDMVVADPRVVCVQLPVRDGVTIVRRTPAPT